jgi:hypothetical protein
MGIKAVPERMDSRILKTVQHFMTEIERVQGSSKPLQLLNQEVVKETTASIDNWMKKQEPVAQPNVMSVGSITKDNDFSRLFEDTNSRYESMLSERAPIQNVPVDVPDFRLKPTEEESIDPVVLMQRAQKQRDDQARAIANINPPRLQVVDDKPPSATNPIPVQAEPPPPLLAPRPQDYIIPQQDIVKYRETEYNVFMTSSDRDWVRNTSENRYNFSVIFNTGNTKSTLGYNAAVQQRFRNIQRIEFVKAIVPIEALNPLVRVTNVSTIGPNVVGLYDTSRVLNVFGLPFVSVRIAELNNNGFSTKPEEDNTFAIVQYDTTWSSDLIVPPATNANTGNNYTGHSSVVAAKTGYTGLIPKFMKSQRIYTPTPLASLNKLSIRIERHTTELLNGESDVFAITQAYLSGNVVSLGADQTKYASITSPLNPYIFLQTSQFFLFSAISEGDLVNIQGYTVSPSGATSVAATNDISDFINRPSGHNVIATGYSDGSNIYLGRNDAGYCNIIILRSRFDDPTTGSTGRNASYFGGDAAQEAVGVLPATMNGAPAQSACSLINMSRQVHIVLRIITRDLDSGSNIRPDNV